MAEDVLRRTVVGEWIHLTAVDEALQLLGHDPADVVEVHLTRYTVTVTEVERTDTTRTLVTYQHVVRDSNH